jgi:hypothetical protein
MNAKRFKAIAKLALLFGIPLSLVLGLFGSGVHCGVQNRHAILAFERDWLGLDVEVPDPPAAQDDADEVEPSERKTPAQEGDAAGEPGGSDAPRERPPERERDPVREREPVAVDPVEPSRPPVAEAPETRADPLEGDLAERFALPVTVHVKVLVAPELIDVQPEWIDYVQRIVSQTSRIYQKQFGIGIELVAVGRWPIATEGLSARVLLDDLARRPREGADVLLGFTLDTAREGPLDDEASPFNRATTIVPATPGTGGRPHDAHLRTMLREVGHVFGARDIVDPEDPQWQAGSWMSHAAVGDGQAPWIDGDNRRRILERKDKPFQPEAPGE